MRKHWLRGMLLGVSLVLLLAGGVALAAPAITIDPWCFECCDKYEEEWACDGWAVETTGWHASENLGVATISPGPYGAHGGFLGKTDDTGTYLFDLYLMCSDCVMYDLAGTVNGGDFIALCADWAAGDYGEWSIEITSYETAGGTPGSAVGHFLFGEDCAALEEEEFVPEPGTIMLLGSGLAGLAGYATLRWRTRD